MARNGLIVRDIQQRIMRIVNEAPKLFKRLKIVVPFTKLWEIINQQNCQLHSLSLLILGDRTQITPPVAGNIVSNETVAAKEAELDHLTQETIQFFQRLEGYINWPIVYDICNGRGIYFVPQPGEEEELEIALIYQYHLDMMNEQEMLRRREEKGETSSSSVDSCNREIW